MKGGPLTYFTRHARWAGLSHDLSFLNGDTTLGPRPYVSVIKLRSSLPHPLGNLLWIWNAGPTIPCRSEGWLFFLDGFHAFPCWESGFRKTGRSRPLRLRNLGPSGATGYEPGFSDEMDLSVVARSLSLDTPTIPSPVI